MASQLTDKAKTFRTSFTYEGAPVTITLNPDLTVDLAILRRPASKFTLNALAEYLNSKKVGSGKLLRKTFALNGKEIVVFTPPANNLVNEDPLAIEECAPVDDGEAAA